MLQRGLPKCLFLQLRVSFSTSWKNGRSGNSCSDLNFIITFFLLLLQVKLVRLWGEAGIMWKHFCVSSCEIVGAFFSLFGAFPSLWSQPGCLLGRESWWGMLLMKQILFPSCFKSLNLIQAIGTGMYESSWLRHTLPIVGSEQPCTQPTAKLWSSSIWSADFSQ